MIDTSRQPKKLEDAGFAPEQAAAIGWFFCHSLNVRSGIEGSDISNTEGAPEPPTRRIIMMALGAEKDRLKETKVWIRR
jgi:hypothetical protein